MDTWSIDEGPISFVETTASGEVCPEKQDLDKIVNEHVYSQRLFKKTLMLNIMSSPGAVKTSLILKTIGA